MQALFDRDHPVEAWRNLVRPGETVGLKVNTLGGRGISTNVQLVAAICERLQEAGIKASDIVVWDRDSEEMERAGFHLASAETACNASAPTASATKRNWRPGQRGQPLSKILTQRSNVLINVPVLKDHDGAGVTIALKNMYGVIHNPNKYHPNGCNPYIADLNMLPEIRSRMRLTICDATTAMYEGGPGYKPEHSWNAQCPARLQDPVALDYTGWQIIERKRAEKGLKTLEGRGARAALHCDRGRCASTGWARMIPKRFRLSRCSRKRDCERGSICSVNWMCEDAKAQMAPLDRRSFMKCALASGAALGMASVAPPAAASPPARLPQAQDDARFIVEAKFYQKLPNRKIKCKLCPRECTVGDKERGYCGVRENRGGTYYSLVHSRVCAAHVDPIEKKPLFHYLPGTNAFSMATAGCNVNCKFCQNWDISQSRPEQIPAEYAPPQRVAELAKQYSCPTIAYTYSEPVVFAEYLMDAADAGHAAGIRSIVVSNGYMQEEALKAAYGKMDAVKIDLKSFTESYYRKVVTGQLKPVLDSLVTLRKMGKWTEIVYLVLPTLNDSDAEFRGLAQWIKANLGADVPLHFTQFHPEYLLKNCPSRRCPLWNAPRRLPTPRGCTTSTSAMCRDIRRKTLTAPSAARCWWSAWGLRPARC
jgi:pyruvate formate lyase activating enzyme